MSTQEESSELPVETDRQSDETDPETAAGDSVALVDFFDQLDRAAFSRSLAQRKRYYPVRPNSRS